MEFTRNTLDRMMHAVQRLRERLAIATSVLDAAGIPYAVVGGKAVEAWVSSIDPSLVRSTRNLDLLLRREDSESTKEALVKAGLSYRRINGTDDNFDHTDSNDGSAVRILFANERVFRSDLLPTPDVTSFTLFENQRVVSLDALVEMKLNAHRRIDQVHLLDMLDAGIIDSSWVAKLTAELGARLQHLIDTPNG